MGNNGSSLRMVHRSKLRPSTSQARNSSGERIPYQCEPGDLLDATDAEWQRGGPVISAVVVVSTAVQHDRAASSTSDLSSMIRNARNFSEQSIWDVMICQVGSCAVCTVGATAPYTPYRLPFIHATSCLDTDDTGVPLFRPDHAVPLDQIVRCTIEQKVVTYFPRGRVGAGAERVLTAVCRQDTCSVCRVPRRRDVRTRQGGDSSWVDGGLSSMFATRRRLRRQIVAAGPTITGRASTRPGGRLTRNGARRLAARVGGGLAAAFRPTTSQTPPAGLQTTVTETAPRGPVLRMCHNTHLRFSSDGIMWRLPFSDGAGGRTDLDDDYFLAPTHHAVKWGGPTYSVVFPDYSVREVMACRTNRCNACSDNNNNNADQTGTPTNSRPFVHRIELSGMGIVRVFAPEKHKEYVMPDPTATIATLSVQFRAGGPAGRSSITTQAEMCTSGQCKRCDDEENVAPGDERSGAAEYGQTMDEAGNDPQQQLQSRTETFLQAVNLFIHDPLFTRNGASIGVMEAAANVGLQGEGSPFSPEEVIQILHELERRGILQVSDDMVQIAAGEDPGDGNASTPRDSGAQSPGNDGNDSTPAETYDGDSEPIDPRRLDIFRNELVQFLDDPMFNGSGTDPVLVTITLNARLARAGSPLLSGRLQGGESNFDMQEASRMLRRLARDGLIVIQGGRVRKTWRRVEMMDDLDLFY